MPSAEDAGGGDNTDCELGSQDEDSDGECEEDCATSALDCGATGSCVIEDGSATCECNEFHQGADCSECTDDGQDNDGNGECAQACPTDEETCGSNYVCDDSTGDVECVCSEGLGGPMCDSCRPAYHDDDGDGTCEFCGLAPAFGPNFKGATRLVFTNTTAAELPIGAIVEFVFDHAELVTNNLSLENGHDLRVVHFEMGGAAPSVEPHGIDGETNQSETRLLFELRAALAAGQSTTEYTLFFNYPEADAPTVVTFSETHSLTANRCGGP
ncbi:MAG: hypothetical protein GY811_09075 [Myxococcales bacterium]|nr:hypothetical protein [Myxococcales bacterium]